MAEKSAIDKAKKKQVNGLVEELATTRHRMDELLSRIGELQATNRDLDRRLAEIYFTHELFKALGSTINLQEVTDLLVDAANGILGAEISCCYLLEPDGVTLALKSGQGVAQGDVKLRIKVGRGVVGRAAREGSIANLADASNLSPNDSFLRRTGSVSSIVAVPLAMPDRLQGVLVVATAVPRVFGDSELERLGTIAGVAALSIQNALLHQEIERLSATDRLTELYNHGYFQQRLAEELERSDRHGRPLTIVMLDIDHFKEFNDTFGHPKGDAVLKGVSEVFRGHIREIDMAARYGGEEFVAVLPETDKKGGMRIAERIRRAVEVMEFAGDEEFPVVHKTASLGVATYPVDADSQSLLIERADQALYAAKRGGRNAVVDCAAPLRRST